jgi:hypothetical protein
MGRLKAVYKDPVPPVESVGVQRRLAILVFRMSSLL